MDGVYPTDTIATTHLLFLLLLLLLWLLLLFRTPSFSVYLMPLTNRMREWIRRKECLRGETEREKEREIDTEKKIEIPMTMRLVTQSCVQRKSKKLLKNRFCNEEKRFSETIKCEAWRSQRHDMIWFNIYYHHWLNYQPCL